ncbi:MAG: ATPase [Pseudolabrys sp.]|nr:ATPase [Pseudolabrys sp.]
MRDIFDEIYAKDPRDPGEAARRSLRPQLRKRFFKSAAVAPEGAGFAVRLDGKAVKTPARRTLVAPTRALAEKLAQEWEAQREVIDPARMPLTRLANAIIDAVVDQPRPVAEEIAHYLGTDLVFYRADTPQVLIERQAKHWDPLLDFARNELGARFVLGEGVVHVAQPHEVVASAARAIPADPWRLGALSSVTTLTGSALIALALARGALSADQAWAAAHVDEDWNMEMWGRDEIAMARRDARRAEFDAAGAVLALS